VIPKSQTVFHVIEPVTASMRLSTCLTVIAGNKRAAAKAITAAVNAHHRHR
jgi:hypothetical protein